jgi:hypothetical protein
MPLFAIRRVRGVPKFISDFSPLKKWNLNRRTRENISQKSSLCILNNIALKCNFKISVEKKKKYWISVANKK